jgi:hypothetical protein
MLVSMWDKNNYMCFFQPHLTPLVKVHIMFTKNGIHTLANIVIANPMQVDLLP